MHKVKGRRVKEQSREDESKIATTRSKVVDSGHYQGLITLVSAGPGSGIFDGRAQKP